MPRKPHDPSYFDGDVAIGVATAGTNQATATLLQSNWSQVDTCSADTTGVISRAISRTEKYGVVNGTAVSFTLYPPVGVSFNGLTANVGITVAPNKGVWWIALNSTKYALFGT